MALNTLASRSITRTRPSLMRPASRQQDTDIGSDTDDEPLSRSAISEASKEGSMRVKFLSHPAVRSISESMPWSNAEIGTSIERSSSPQSDISTSSEASVLKSPVFKTLAARLSFWSRLSKRQQRTPTSPEFPLIPEPMSLTEEQEVLDRLMNEAKEEPAEVIESILASTAPAPATVEEKHLEMETKIIRECVREFTKGGMYFAYTFGMYPFQTPSKVLLTSFRHHTITSTQIRASYKSS